MTDPGPIDHSVKVVMLGDSAVGKSSLMSNFISGGTFEEDIGSTIGVDFKVKYLTQSGKKVKLTVWDTAGQERFRTLTSSYYRGVHGVVLVYDVTNRESFEHILTWLAELQRYVSYGDIVKLLVANKIDLGDARVVLKSEGVALARESGMVYIETSAKTSVGVQQTFTEVVQKILDSPVLLKGSTVRGPGDKVDLSEGQRGGTGEARGCCW